MYSHKNKTSVLFAYWSRRKNRLKQKVCEGKWKKYLEARKIKKKKYLEAKMVWVLKQFFIMKCACLLDVTERRNQILLLKNDYQCFFLKQVDNVCVHCPPHCLFLHANHGMTNPENITQNLHVHHKFKLVTNFKKSINRSSLELFTSLRMCHW